MGNRSDIDRLHAHMDSLWARLNRARERGDWQEYWALRRIWIAIGRLYTAELARQEQRASGQLELLDHSEGRSHDRAS